METINKAVGIAVDTVTRTIYGTEEEDHTEQKPYKPTEHQIRDETIGTQSSHDTIPTQGPGQSIYNEKPIVTTTNETSKLTNESPGFQNISMRDTGSPVKGHRRADSGHAEAEGISERFARPDSGAHQRYGYENEADDGIQRTADEGSLSVEGYPRPKFVGNETSEDGIRRSDGRDRVQFDDDKGSTGSLKPSGEPSSERPRQGSTGNLPFMDFGGKGGLPQGARIGTVQGGTVRDRQQNRDLEDAQTAQSGGFGGSPAMFGTTGGYSPSGSKFTENLPASSIPGVPTQEPPSKDSSLQQVKSVTEDTTQGKSAESHPSGEEDFPASSIPGVPSGDRHESVYRGEDTAFRPATADQKPPSTTRPDAGADQTSHPPAQTFTTSSATIGPQRSSSSSVEHPSSSNEPHSQGDTTNPATTNAISAMRPGLTKGTHGPVEPSVGANPTHAQQQTQKHQGSDRPTEEPQGHVPQPGVDQKGEGQEKRSEPGHLWVKTKGTAADGGDFDATKPGAGREADRLLEQAGVHRTLDHKPREDDETKGVKDSHYNITTTSGNPANPTHHLDSAADGGRGSHGGLHMPGILHHHDRKKDAKETGGEGTGHKGLAEKIKEKLHI